MRILVFPCSNEPGLELATSLSAHPRRHVVGASSVDPRTDPWVGRGVRHALPMLGAPDFEEALDRLVETEAIDQVFASVDAVVEALAGRDLGRAVLVGPSASAARVCGSKRAMLAALAGVVPLPRSVEEEPAWPAFAKPDRGGGGRDTRRIDDADAWLQARAAGLVLQELLPGEEYTVDCLGDREGKLVCAFPRRRVSVGRGIALASEPVDRPDLVAMVEAVAERIPVAGVYFVQFRENEAGEPVFLEINARAAGSLGATRLRGANLPLMASMLWEGHAVRAPVPVDVGVVVRRLVQAGRLDGVRAVVWDLDDTLIDVACEAYPTAVGWLHTCRRRGIRQRLLTLNPDPLAALERALVPAALFEEVVSVPDKLPVLASWLGDTGWSVHEVLVVNDSGSERLAMQAAFPGLRCIGPESLEALGWLEGAG
jgi:carbamoyl-phosphate synthase large subunit